MSLTWTSHSIGSGIQNGPIAVNNATGVAILNSSQGVYKSTDGGSTWSTNGSFATTGADFGIGFGGGRYVVKIGGGTIYHSVDDGVTWVAAVTPPTGLATNAFVQIAFSSSLGTGNGMWMLVQGASYSASTDGGATWGAMTAISALSSGSRFANNLFWDGTEFSFTGRDSGNNNCLAVSTTNGSTWTSSNLGSIFSTNEANAYCFGPGTYTVGIISTRAVRQASSIAGLASASNTDVSSLLPGSTFISSVYSPDGVMCVASGSPNSTTSNSGLIEQDTPGGSWADSTSPLATSTVVNFFAYDNFHGKFIASTASSGTDTIITAPYTLQAIVPNVVNDVLATGEAAITQWNSYFQQMYGENYLVVGTVTPTYNGSVPAGEIISTNPSAGTLVSPGSSVNISVSLGGIPTVTVSPHSKSINFGSSFLFTATTANPTGEACTWSVNGVIGGDSVHGTVVNGYYVAPASPNGVVTVTVTATMQTFGASDSATVTLVPPTVGGAGMPPAGRFRGQKVFPPVALSKAATIPLRIYEPEENKTIKG